MTKIKANLILLFIVILFIIIVFIIYTYFGNELYERFSSRQGSRQGSKTAVSGSKGNVVGGVAIASRQLEKNNSDNDVLDDNKEEIPFYFPFYSNGTSRTQNNNSNYEASNNTNIFNRSCGMCGMVEVV
jgi:hypothetical protein